MNHTPGSWHCYRYQIHDQTGIILAKGNVDGMLPNSKNFGVAQNRERVFIIGYLRGQPRPEVFPIRRANSTNLKQLNKGRNPSNRLYDINGISCTLKGGAGGRGAKTGLYLTKYQRPQGNNAGGTHNHLLSKCRIRRLTPLECFRLQSFPDEWYYKLREHISDTQMYKLAGNAVTVNVIEDIGRRLKCK